MPRSREILFLDKDDTLIDRNLKLYPGVEEFLREMNARARRCYVATTAGAGGRAHVESLIQAGLIKDYFGSEQIGSTGYPYYRKPGGEIRSKRDDFISRSPWSAQRQAKLEALLEALYQEERHLDQARAKLYRR